MNAIMDNLQGTTTKWEEPPDFFFVVSKKMEMMYHFTYVQSFSMNSIVFHRLLSWFSIIISFVSY